MKDYSGLNAARLRTLLREHDLDHPLTDMDLAFRILDIESRLDGIREDMIAVDTTLQDHGIEVRYSWEA